LVVQTWTSIWKKEEEEEEQVIIMSDAGDGLQKSNGYLQKS
jgi:hypothetical protein